MTGPRNVLKMLQRKKSASQLLAQVQQMWNETDDPTRFPEEKMRQLLTELRAAPLEDLQQVAQGFNVWNTLSSSDKKSRNKLAEKIERKLSAAHRAWSANRV